MNNTQKIQFIQALTANEEVSDFFLINAAQQQQARNGPYWRLELKDRTGTVEAKIWSPQSQDYPELTAGTIAHIQGHTIVYRDKLEFAINSLRVLSESESKVQNIADFLPASERQPEHMLNELKALVRKTCVHAPWRRFLLNILTNKEISSKLCTAPAAKVMHHAYVGGLLEHTLSVAQVCMRFADHYPEIDRQVLLAGAICHDFGKMWELSSGLTIEYTTEGYLLGHINLIQTKIEPFIKRAGLAEELKIHLLHLILSHHGSYEFGAPRLPQTAEAFALHYADNLDAKLAQIKEALKDIPPQESGWSGYLRSLETRVFQAQRSPEQQKPLSLRDNKKVSTQCSLLAKE